MTRSGDKPPQPALDRRTFLAGAAAVCASGAAAAEPASGRLVVPGVDRFRVREPLFEGVRIVLRAMGDVYSPAYIQGISGAAFRIAGICPCAPDCSSQMSTPDLLRLLGYQCEEAILGWTGDVDDARQRIGPLVARVKEVVRSGRPVLVWYAFADTAFEVVAGYDERKGVFLGRHAHQPPRAGLASAKQTRAADAAEVCPAFGALFIGARTGELDRAAAETAALKEAVRHARDTKVSQAGPPRQGIACYDSWVEHFRSADTKRGPGDAYCNLVYRTTHRAASAFLREIAGRYPRAGTALRRASREFGLEADALDRAEPLMGWSSPEHDAARNARLCPILAEARDHYAAATACIEDALARM